MPLRVDWGSWEHHFPPARARSLIGAGGERTGQRDGGNHLVFAQTQQFTGGDGGSQRSVNRAGSEPSGLGGRDEITGYAGLYFVSGGHGRNQLRAGGSAQLG